jgi:uncharacterized protein
MSTLIVIAKAPVPGRVKTRLTPPFTPEQAADLARAALQDTLDAVLATHVDRRLLVLDGCPDDAWLPKGFTVVPQVSGSLDRRLVAAFREAASIDAGPVLLIGMDTPQVTAELLTSSLPTAGDDATFGPATDGGFWSLAFREPRAVKFDELILDVPMSHPETGRIQHARLRSTGLAVRSLPELCDVDDAEDAALVADLSPEGRFGRRHRELTEPGEHSEPGEPSAPTVRMAGAR